MEIIPAIDIIKGKCVRLVKGKFGTKRVYSSNPFRIAQVYERAGLKRLHLIDLDGAKQGQIKNWRTISKIAKNTNLEIEFGGGIQDEKALKKLLGLGINRVILGSLALKQPERFRKILKKFKEKIIVGIDVKKDKIYYHGWQKESKKEFYPFLKKLTKLWVKTIICTDIGRDGTLKGPNFSLYKKLVKNFPKLRIIASGGIRNKRDLKKLSKIGVQGAVVGKAIYEKRISLNNLKSMLPKKIVPCLDCKLIKGKWKVVKGIKFENLILAGDPVRLAKEYSREGADEIAMLDISASQENRKPFFDLVKKVSKVIKIPLVVGGGISTLSDIEKLLKAGADKVSLNTSVVENPQFLSKANKKFGSGRIIVAIDTKKGERSWKVCISGGTKVTDLDAIKWAKEVEKRGAGELLPTSKDKDGTKEGYDIEFLRKLKGNVSIPIIASGGAGRKKDFLDAFIEGKADATLAASLFHFKEIKILDLKKYLRKNGININ